MKLLLESFKYEASFWEVLSFRFETFVLFFVFEVPPKIVEFVFGEEAKREGGVAQVNCIVKEGDTPLTIAWSFHGQKLESNHLGIDTVKVGVRTSILSIDKVTAAHSGLYTCKARNAAGEDKFSAVLEVAGSNLF
jgi:hypothetical protein